MAAQTIQVLDGHCPRKVDAGLSLDFSLEPTARPLHSQPAPYMLDCIQRYIASLKVFRDRPSFRHGEWISLDGWDKVSLRNLRSCVIGRRSMLAKVLRDKILQLPAYTSHSWSLYAP